MALYRDSLGEPISIARKLTRVNWLLVLVLGVIAGVGLASLYSVADGSLTPWAERHAARFLAGMGMVLAIAVVPIGFWLRVAYPVYGVALLMLALVPVIGIEAMGAKRWLGVGSVTFQPSEVMKIALIVMLARYYEWVDDARRSHPLWVLVPVVAIAVPVVLVLKQPDLGTATLFAIVGVGLMFAAGVAIWYFIGAGCLVATAVPFVWHFLHDYQRRRIEVFLNPEADPLGGGYHIMQSKIALASGGLNGRGFMRGTQSQLDFLPEKHTDFIFTMFAEEWGFVGAIGLLGLFVLVLLFLLWMALRCRSRFARLVIMGAGLVLFVYVFINVAMVTGLVPVVGVPLPLVSYGGTSMITFLFALGLAMSGYVHRDRVFRRREVGPLV